jgi:hypothetical protein
MEELAYKIVKVHSAGDELVARIDNFEVCKAAFRAGVICLAQRASRNAPGCADRFEI